MQELPPLVVRAPQAAAEVGVPLTRRQLTDAGGHIPAYQQAGRHVGGGVGRPDSSGLAEMSLLAAEIGATRQWR